FREDLEIMTNLRGQPTGQHDASLMAASAAALAIVSETDPDVLLQRLVDLAREVVPANYAALGITNESGDVVRFLTSGISAEERAALGPIPRGHGLIGALVTDRAPLLVPDIAADPRSVGFPPGHPVMRTLLGVPILLGDRVLGNLYLTERIDGQPFTQEDLAAVQLLAAHAATAIERAGLYQELRAGRQRAEEERDQFGVILDHLPAGIWIHRAPGGDVELVNASARRILLGPDAPAGTTPLYGRDFRFLRSDGAPLPEQERPGMRALRGELAGNRQVILDRWDGSQIPLLVQAAPLRDASGAIPRAVVVLQDITRLREAEQLKDDFLSLISHEFRTPLTSIQGGAHLLVQQGATLDDETRQELLADIVTESERLDRMLGNMLSLTAILAGRLEPATEPVLLEPLARRVARDLGRQPGQHQFVIDLPPDLPAAEGDPDLLAQVLRNLYENAVKYSPGGGEVRVTGASNDQTVTLHVTDHGTGIHPEHVRTVFERFRRVGADPTVRGMGLGLYLSRYLIEAQGGTIDASSPGPGKGATFSISLPIAVGWQESEDVRAETADPGRR
ncbi:MAG TPA: ATP-binding protein, partial [Thermomicrobiales bacterium]|nr:ATP-binding protein [Thermomicrobiales bacterium]